MASRRTRSTRRRIAPEAVLRPPLGTERTVGTVVIGAAVWYATMALAMVACVAAAGPQDRLEARLAVDPDLLPYRLAFVAASLLAPAFVTLLVLLVWARGERFGVRDTLAMLLLPAYLVCSSIAYVSQFAMLPRLVELDPSTAAAWYFQDERSVPYALDLLGYAFLGLALCLLAGGFLGGRRAFRVIGWLLAACGGTSVAAFVALALGWGAATSLLTWTSASLTLPLAVLAVLLGTDLRRRPAPVLDVEPADFWA